MGQRVPVTMLLPLKYIEILWYDITTLLKTSSIIVLVARWTVITLINRPTRKQCKLLYCIAEVAVGPEWGTLLEPGNVVRAEFTSRLSIF